MLVTHQERPRELKWYHAGPLLYGDLGTSRFYVLGLAFYYALYASLWYVIGVGVLVAAVGWAYTIICRAYPDGGGVYSAARQISPVLSVVGALLLFADYAVTAALSAFEGFRYFGVQNTTWVAVGACGAILLLGIVNYVGPKKAGNLALLIALATLVMTLLLAALAIPHLPQGWSKLQTIQLNGQLREHWVTLANVVLALSGVEAVANMTGIMVAPVGRTAKKAIWPVLCEVIFFNVLFAVAMLAVHPAGTVKSNGDRDFTRPAAVYDAHIQKLQRDLADARARAQAQPSYEYTVEDLERKLEEAPRKSEFENQMKDKVLRVMGEQFAAEAGAAVGGPAWREPSGRIFGTVAGFVFGLLLISAVNTVLGGMISVQYVMARDGELPKFFNRLNVFGVPWVGLLPAVAIPIVLLMIFSELEQLADLYAIGVVGAIAINLTSCTINRKLPIKRWERFAMGAIAVVMAGIELTLATEKLHALIFVLLILGVGLGMRMATKRYPAIKAWYRARRAAAAPAYPEAAAPTPALPLSSLGTPPAQLDMNKPHVMVATRGGPRLIEFAANYARQVDGILFVIFVRQLNVQFLAEAKGPTLEEDRSARAVFENAAEACRKAGVAMVPIYVVSADVAYSILDFAATYNVSALLMGVSRKGTLLRALQGDVLTSVADNLPQDIPLLIHA